MPCARAAPLLGPHHETIREWLHAELSPPRKQRHTARRIWQRLVDERGATVAEPTVRAYVARVRRKLEYGQVAATVLQLHPPGAEAEVDFGRGQRLACWRADRALDVRDAALALRPGGACLLPERRPGDVPERPHVRLRALRQGARAGALRQPQGSCGARAAGRERVGSDRFTALRSHFGFDAFFRSPGLEGAKAPLHFSLTASEDKMGEDATSDGEESMLDEDSNGFPDTGTGGFAHSGGVSAGLIGLLIAVAGLGLRRVRRRA